jgi:hypothetical protein
MIKYKDSELRTLDKLVTWIKHENLTQIKKWGIQERTLPEWLMFLGEEVGELNEACAEFEYRNGDIDNIAKEALQVATLALKIMEIAQNPFGVPEKEFEVSRGRYR